ncbi:MAG TPA: hypothetical protein VF691_19220, partial [Cytophagaceae bacterium]
MLKDTILSKIDSKSILDYYLSPFHSKGSLREQQQISNPFLIERQKTPSFHIFKGANGEFRFIDPATGDKGSCFDLVMKIKGVDFTEALKIVANDFSIDLGDLGIQAPSLPESSEPKAKPFSIKLKAFNPEELYFWGQSGITSETIDKYSVLSVESYSKTNSDGKEYTINSAIDNPIFAYQVVKDKVYKIYRPFDKYKFSWLGDKPNDFTFGFDQLKDGDNVFIAAGEKDVLTLSSSGYPAITLNSETADLPKDVLKKLQDKFKEVIVIYDIDETGLKQSDKLAKEHGLARILLPEELTKKGLGKDVTDYFKAFNDGDIVFDNSEWLNVRTFASLINEAIKNKPTREFTFLDRLEACQFNLNDAIEEPEPLISIEGNTISTPGNITSFIGASKSGKTGLMGALLSGVIA